MIKISPAKVKPINLHVSNVLITGFITALIEAIQCVDDFTKYDKVKGNLLIRQKFVEIGSREQSFRFHANFSPFTDRAGDDLYTQLNNSIFYAFIPRQRNHLKKQLDGFNLREPDFRFDLLIDMAVAFINGSVGSVEEAIISQNASGAVNQLKDEGLFDQFTAVLVEELELRKRFMGDCDPISHVLQNQAASRKQKWLLIMYSVAMSAKSGVSLLADRSYSATGTDWTGIMLFSVLGRFHQYLDQAISFQQKMDVMIGEAKKIYGDAEEIGNRILLRANLFGNDSRSLGEIRQSESKKLSDQQSHQKSNLISKDIANGNIGICDLVRGGILVSQRFTDFYSGVQQMQNKTEEGQDEKSAKTVRKQREKAVHPLAQPSFCCSALQIGENDPVWRPGQILASIISPVG